MTEMDIIIEPRKGRKEKSLPQRALMVVNPAEAESAFTLFRPFSGETRALYEAQVAVDRNKQLCVAGPALGAPAAVLILEKLIVLGVREIWLVSCCGSLDPSHLIGDILVGTAAVSGEGVSRYYVSENVVSPGMRVTADIDNFVSHHGLNAHRGAIWSTDAPYRERRSELLSLQERHAIVGVDMEFSALCSVAQVRGVSLGGLFVVSDMLWTRNWKPGFGGAGFRNSSRSLIEKIIQYGLQMDPEEFNRK